jgi:hypothetical protein
MNILETFPYDLRLFVDILSPSIMSDNSDGGGGGTRVLKRSLSVSTKR